MEEGTRVGGNQRRNRPHFFKVFFPGLNSEQLEISPAFREHIEGEPSGTTCSITGPSGNVWHVDLIRNEDGGGPCFFRTGWEDFVGDHSLQTGDFLVFEYDGNSRFSVMVFDASACEKEAAFYARPSSRIVAAAVEKRDTSEPVSCVSSQKAFGVAPRKWKKKKNGNERSPAARRLLWKQTEGSRKRRRESRSGVTSSRNVKKKRKKSKSNGSRSRGRGMLVSLRRPVTEEEIERAYRAASSFKSRNPFLLLVMRKSGVYMGHAMSLPHFFSKRYLPRVTAKITLWNPSGNSWTVTYIPNKNSYYLSAGWRKFTIDNHLEQDDACVFELVRTNEIQVHIFRVVEEITPLIRKIKGAKAEQ